MSRREGQGESVSPIQLNNNNKNIVQYVYISEIYSP